MSPTMSPTKCVNIGPEDECAVVAGAVGEVSASGRNQHGRRGKIADGSDGNDCAEAAATVTAEVTTKQPTGANRLGIQTVYRSYLDPNFAVTVLSHLPDSGVPERAKAGQAAHPLQTRPSATRVASGGNRRERAPARPESQGGRLVSPATPGRRVRPTPLRRDGGGRPRSRVPPPRAGRIPCGAVDSRPRQAVACRRGRDAALDGGVPEGQGAARPRAWAPRSG